MCLRSDNFQMLNVFTKITVLICVLFLPVSNSVALPPQLALADMDGNEHRLSDYRGKWLLVNYWATWCAPCVAELPQLQAFHQRNEKNNVLVISVNFEEIEMAPLAAFLQRHKISLPVWLASPDEPSPWGRIRGLPTSFIISPNGELLRTYQGLIDLEQVAALIAESDK